MYVIGGRGGVCTASVVNPRRGAKGKAKRGRLACEAVSTTWQWSHSRSPYEVLNVPRDASLREVKAAFRKLAKEYHPDMCPIDDESDTNESPSISKASCEARFIEIRDAFEELSGKRQQRWEREARDNFEMMKQKTVGEQLAGLRARADARRARAEVGEGEHQDTVHGGTHEREKKPWAHSQAMNEGRPLEDQLRGLKMRARQKHGHTVASS